MDTGHRPEVDVSKHYDRHGPAALDHLNLTIGQSEFVAITGPSGCGKSTLLHLIAGLDRPSSGTRCEGQR